MTTDAGQIRVFLGADTSEFDNKMKGVGSTMDGVKAKVGALGGAIKTGLLVGTAAVAGLGAAALKFAGDFDSAYDTIRTGTGATGDALKGLQDDFRQVVKSVPTDFGSAGQAIADLNTRLGITGPHLQIAATQFLELSRITGTDLNTNIQTVTRAFGDWSIATDDQREALDSFFKVSQATGPSVDELARLVVQFGAPLRQFNFSFEESIALLGKWQKEGVNTELVMGSLRIAGGKFAKENIPLRDGLEDTIAKIQEMGPSAEATALAMEIFGSRAGVDMVDSILNGKFAIEDLVKTIDESQDSIFKVGRETQDWQESLTLLKNNVLIALEPLLNRVFSAVGEGAVAFRAITEAVIDALQGGENFEDMLADMSPTMQGITHALVSLATFIKDDFAPTFATGFKTILEAVKPVLIAAIAAIGAAIVLALGPGAAAVLAITGIITLVGLIKQEWDSLKAKTDEVWNAIPGPIRFFAEFFAGEVATKVKATIDFFITQFNILKDAVELVMALIQGDWSRAWEEVKSIASRVVGQIVNVIEMTFGSLPGKLFNLGKRAGEELIRGIKSIPGVKEALDVAGGVADFIGGGFSKIPGLASGGPASGWTIVGERGWELANFPTGTRVFDHQDSQRMLAGARSVESEAVVNFLGPVTIQARDREDAIRATGDVAWGLTAAMRARGVT